MLQLRDSIGPYLERRSTTDYETTTSLACLVRQTSNEGAPRAAVVCTMALAGDRVSAAC